MKTHNLILAAFMGTSCVAASAHATLVLADDFDDADETLLAGKAADVGGPWAEDTGTLGVNGGIIDTTGAARRIFADFTDTLSAGRTLTLTLDMAEAAGAMFTDGWAGVSLFEDDAERIFVGDLGVDTFWGVDETGVGTLSTTNTDEDNTATFTYAFDTGEWSLSLSSGDALIGFAAPGIAANRLRIANDGGGDLALDMVSVDFSGGTVIGDTDGDGDIDDFDLLNAISNFTGSLAPGSGGKGIPEGDTDDDTDVDDFDLLTMISGFTGSLSPSSTSVPEPSSLALLAVGTLLRPRRDRRR